VVGKKWTELSRAERREFVDGVVDRHGLRRGSDGRVFWSESAAAEVFDRAGMLISVWAGASGEPSLGVCLTCGDPVKVRLHSVLRGIGVCGSNRCGGNKLPPAEIMRGKLSARGFDVFGDLPASNKESFTIRHAGKDYLTGNDSPCGQLFTGTWDNLIRASRGCAVCRGIQVVIGYNDLATTDPHLVDRFVFPQEATEITRSTIRRVQLWCAADGCSHIVSQRVADLTNGHSTQCGDHQPYAWSCPQFHYAIPVWTAGGDFLGTVYGHSAAEKIAGRLKKHAKTADRHGLLLGDITLQPAGSKDEAMARDYLPRRLTDAVSIPYAYYGDAVIKSKWDGWVQESVAYLTPTEVLAFMSSGEDGWSSDRQPLIRIGIDDFLDVYPVRFVRDDVEVAAA